MTHVVSFPPILACLSRPLGAALVSALQTMTEPYLTSWREETQERYRPAEKIARHFAGLAGDCHLLASAI
jgi:hypothetical protein